MTFLLIGLAAFVAWIVSTIGGGGGALLLVPAAGFLIGAQAVAPVVTLASVTGGISRSVLFWRDIEWRIVRWYLPGAIVGAVAGAWAFTAARAEWLQLVIGLFLVSTVWQYRFGRKARAFRVRLWWFLPAGLLVSFFSGLIGATGPVLNPLYLNIGAVKERMIGTKTVSSLVMHVVKVGTYTAFGALTSRLLLYGLVAGAAAVAASWVGKRMLRKIAEERFRQLVIAVMVASGIAMIWDQRAVIAGIWGWGWD